MNTIARIGVDLAKNVMQIHAVDQSGHIVTRKAISRANFLNRFANLPPCLVAMEACSAAHYWARRLRSLGHDVRLIARLGGFLGRKSDGESGVKRIWLGLKKVHVAAKTLRGLRTVDDVDNCVQPHGFTSQ